MRIRKAVITAAGPGQRRLPLQSLIDRDGTERSVLTILVDRAVRAGVEEICVVAAPGDEAEYFAVLGEHADRVQFVEQDAPRGYGDAIYCARDFTGNEPFLHLMGDHLYVSNSDASCTARLIAVAEAQECSVSAVQATREGLLTRFGAVGGPQESAAENLYRVETVLEKPTPTQAEQEIVVPGLRAGHYLCFFGMHVLTPAVMTILGALLEANRQEVLFEGSRQSARCGSVSGNGACLQTQESVGDAERLSRSVSLSAALAELAQRERYLALLMDDRRFDLGARYGLFTAQLALAMSGRDRTEVVSQVVEVMANREWNGVEARA